MQPEEKMFVTVKDFAALTGIKEHSIRVLTRIQDFPALRIGVKTMILLDEGKAWLVKNAKGYGHSEIHPLSE
ncbi:hypothetical protein D081_1985 [Anaerovibrio sp. JC8]|uniref:DNA-binding protein n=1 Tax=Anaerovibrio sp. JC8 TaxID=1240085 RepID=UPI000A0E4CE9|nr:DNA-binding protein [Anaerovibrio sp. JC8]ORT99433.1 hypothetical protein D081_1985 [Anaerovibrio sp. JC8]